MDVAPWSYKWTGWGLDGSLGNKNYSFSSPRLVWNECFSKITMTSQKSVKHELSQTTLQKTNGLEKRWHMLHKNWYQWEDVI